MAARTASSSTSSLSVMPVQVILAEAWNAALGTVQLLHSSSKNINRFGRDEIKDKDNNNNNFFTISIYHVPWNECFFVLVELEMRSNPKTLEGKVKTILYADQALQCVLILLKSCDKFLVIPVKVELI